MNYPDKVGKRMNRNPPNKIINVCKKEKIPFGFHLLAMNFPPKVFHLGGKGEPTTIETGKKFSDFYS
jgi:hypothetical protein